MSIPEIVTQITEAMKKKLLKEDQVLDWYNTYASEHFKNFRTNEKELFYEKNKGQGSRLSYLFVNTL